MIASENDGRSALTPKALHICRGHFKDFSNHGLFGKYRGTYWWPMHTRGSSDNGLVVKDYRVLASNTPTPGTSQPADSVIGAGVQ